MADVGRIHVSLGSSVAGCLPCDGAAVDPVAYPLLASICANTPTQADLMLRGAGSTALGSIGGADTVTLTTNELPAHSHDLKGHSTAGTSRTASGNLLASESQNKTSFYAVPPNTADINLSSASIANAGSGNSFSIVPQHLAVNFFIEHD